MFKIVIRTDDRGRPQVSDASGHVPADTVFGLVAGASGELSVVAGQAPAGQRHAPGEQPGYLTD